MKLYVETWDVVFEGGKPFEAKRDPEGRQRKDSPDTRRRASVSPEASAPRLL